MMIAVAIMFITTFLLLAIMKYITMKIEKIQSEIEKLQGSKCEDSKEMEEIFSEINFCKENMSRMKKVRWVFRIIFSLLVIFAIFFFRF